MLYCTTLRYHCYSINNLVLHPLWCTKYCTTTVLYYCTAVLFSTVVYYCTKLHWNWCTVLLQSSTVAYQVLCCTVLLTVLLYYTAVPYCCRIIQQPTIHCLHQHELWLSVLPACPFPSCVTVGIRITHIPKGNLVYSIPGNERPSRPHGGRAWSSW